MNKRLEYIDALRGLAILFIVFGHIPMYCYGEFGSTILSFRLFTSMVQIPAFFFVSGFVFNNNPNIKNKKISEKFRQLIVPAIVVGSIYLCVTSTNLSDCLKDKFKSGYWFTLTLFEIIICQYLIDSIWTLFKKKQKSYVFIGFNILTAIIIYGLSLPIIETEMRHIPVISWLSLPLLRYYIYFVMGRLIRIHLDDLVACQFRDKAIGITLIVFFALAIGQWVFNQEANGLFFHMRLVIFESCSLLLIFATFYKYRSYFANEGRVSKIMILLGRRTLDIYLLHYFFLPKDMHIIGEYFYRHPNMIGEMIISSIITLAIVAICLAMSEIIRTSRIFSRWILGAK